MIKINSNNNLPFLIKIKQFIRWHDWALDKLPILFLICFYLILKKSDYQVNDVIDFFVFVVFSISSTIYGYTVNNYADLSIDIAQGKENLLSLLSPINRVIILVLIAGICIGSGIYFTSKPGFLALWVIQFFVASFYSLPPIRFKERGLIGLLIPFIAQLVLPTMICFSIFGDFSSWDFVLFLLYGLFKGGAYDIGHQFHDHDQDQETNTRTFAVDHGSRLVNNIFKTFLILERISFLALLVYMSNTLNISLFSYKISPIILIVVLYLCIFIMVVIKEIKEKRISDPYYIDIRGGSNILHIIIPNIFFPAYISVLLFLSDYHYLPLFIFFMIWVFPTPSKILWPIRAIFKKII